MEIQLFFNPEPAARSRARPGETQSCQTAPPASALSLLSFMLSATPHHHHRHCCSLSACNSFLSHVQHMPKAMAASSPSVAGCLSYLLLAGSAVVLSDHLSKPKIWMLNPTVSGDKFLSRLNYFHGPLPDCHQLT